MLPLYVKVLKILFHQHFLFEDTNLKYHRIDDEHWKQFSTPIFITYIINIDLRHYE